jgi:hypothetical protein
LRFRQALKNPALGDGQKTLRGLLEANPTTRLTAKELNEEFGNHRQEEIFKLSPTPKNLFLHTARHKEYSWLNEINDTLWRYRHKVVFEAMSIADRFIETSRLKSEDFKFAVLAAYYLAANFHHENLDLTEIISLLPEKYSKNKFKRSLMRLIKYADYNLLFNHTLRDFQIELYNDMSSEKRDIAIATLKMLEIHQNTYAFSNDKKWNLVKELISRAISDDNKKILRRLCRSFKDDYLGRTKEYEIICGRNESDYRSRSKKNNSKVTNKAGPNCST